MIPVRPCSRSPRRSATRIEARFSGWDEAPGSELAWTLAHLWWGYGYATEGARAALAHAFNVWQKDRRS